MYNERKSGWDCWEYVHECRLAQWPPFQQCLCSRGPCSQATGSARVDFQHSFPRGRGSKRQSSRGWRPFGHVWSPQRRAAGKSLSLLPFPACLYLRKMISLIKYNTLYIQPTVQLVWGWFSFCLFPSSLCKVINTALDPICFLVPTHS